MYTWGRGWRGMLGHGEENDELEPKILDPLLTKDITQLALSRTFSLALSTQGEVFSWGSGKYGRLGHGNLRDRFLPLMIGLFIRFYSKPANIWDTFYTKVSACLWKCVFNDRYTSAAEPSCGLQRLCPGPAAYIAL